jgi:sodium/proline symporter
MEDFAKIASILVYLAILLLIGWIASRRMSNVREYYAAGKNLSFLPAAFSARATGESAWLLLGLTGMGAAYGAQAFWVVLGEVLGVGLSWLWLCKRFKILTDRYDSVTVPDYLESRFRDTRHLLRRVSAVTLVVFVTIYVSAQIDATGQAFESFMGWNYYVGALIGFVIVMFYIIGGGFVAVVWSDVFQGTLMFLGLVILPFVGIAAAGGWGAVTDGLAAQDPGLLSAWGPDGFSAMTVFKTISFLLIGIGFLGSPQIFVRYIAMRSVKEVPKGGAFAIVYTLLSDSGAVLIGMIGRHLFMEVDLGESGQEVLPVMVENLLPALLVGVYVAIVLSAIMSSVDSLLVLASSAFTRDYWQKVRHPELGDDKLVGFGRTTTFVLALIALGISFLVAATTPDRTIFWFVIFGWSGIAATFCPTMILSLFWKRMTRRGAIAGMVTGFLGIPFFKFIAPSFPGELGMAFNQLEELAPSFAVSFVAIILVSKADKKGQERLMEVHGELDSLRGPQDSI